MANPLAIELAPLAAQATSASGSAVDIGTLRTACRLTLDVTANDGDFTVVIETSPDGTTGWRGAGIFQKTSLPRLRAQVSFAGCDRYVRARWTITGTGATFSISGEAHVVYVMPARLGRLGIPPSALEDLDESVLAEQCIAASDEADGYLRRRYTMPLAGWSTDLERNCAQVAVYEALCVRGFDVEGPDQVVMIRAKDARVWLGKVGAGTITPEITDSTPAKRGTAPRVSTRSRSSGWDC